MDLSKIKGQHIVIAILIAVVLSFLTILGVSAYQYLCLDAYVYEYCALLSFNTYKGRMEYSIGQDIRHGADRILLDDLSKEEFDKIWPKYEALNEELRKNRIKK